MPLFPLEWTRDGQCTGNLLELGRSTQRTRKPRKKEIEDGMDKDRILDNENYGRFFFSRKVPLFNADGSPKMREYIAPSGEKIEVPDSKLGSFHWLDQTPLSTSGTLDALCEGWPDFAKFLRSVLDPKIPAFAAERSDEPPFWPDDVQDMFYLIGWTDAEICEALMGENYPHPQPRAPRKKRKKSSETNGDEAAAGEDVEAVVNEVMAPAPQSQVEVRHAGRLTVLAEA